MSPEQEELSVRIAERVQMDILKLELEISPSCAYSACVSILASYCMGRGISLEKVCEDLVEAFEAGEFLMMGMKIGDQ